MDASSVVTCKAPSLAYWRTTGEASYIGVPLRFFLKYLNFLPDCLEHINKNAYICTVQTNQGHEAAAPNKAAYFVPTCKEIIAATA